MLLHVQLSFGKGKGDTERCAKPGCSQEPIKAVRNHPFEVTLPPQKKFQLASIIQGSDTNQNLLTTEQFDLSGHSW